MRPLSGFAEEFDTAHTDPTPSDFEGSLEGPGSHRYD